MRCLTIATMAAGLLILGGRSANALQDKKPRGDSANPQPNKTQVEAELAKELAKLQGSWELTRRVGNKTIRSVKEIQGNTSRVTRYGPDGKVFWAHTSEFRLSVSGRVRVFTFFNLEVRAGASKGVRDKKPSAYVYRVNDKTLTEARGLLTDHEHEEPRLVVWKRVKARKANKQD